MTHRIRRLTRHCSDPHHHNVIGRQRLSAVHGLLPRAGELMAVVAVMVLTSALVEVQAAEVASQNLRSPMASGKLSAAIWTRRSDRYTMQIVFRSAVYRIVIPDKGDLVAPHATEPTITLWLLRADGTAIPTRKEAPLRSAAKDGLPAEAAYSVGLSAGDEAVAAAIQVDGEYYVEPLQSLMLK